MWLNTGHAGSVCEHAELCVGIQWPGRMWEQEGGYPFEIHQVEFLSEIILSSVVE